LLRILITSYPLAPSLYQFISAGGREGSDQRPACDKRPAFRTERERVERVEGESEREKERERREEREERGRERESREREGE
jgi:hypothetical protein